MLEEAENLAPRCRQRSPDCNGMKEVEVVRKVVLVEEEEKEEELLSLERAPRSPLLEAVLRRFRPLYRLGPETWWDVDR